MFTTSPKPFVMAMIKEAMQQRLRAAIDFDGRMLADKASSDNRINSLRVVRKSSQN
jgi:hypothetical protein